LTNEEYYGGGRREDAIRDITSRGSLAAVVTRNHYGCAILNATNTLFIDVDVSTPDRIESTGNDLRIVLQSEEGRGFRIYRTAAGFRILATSHQFAPDSPHARKLMATAGADTAFVELCGIQNSFRARLSPKPWRCGAPRPPHAFPRRSAFEQQRFSEWLSSYERASRHYATCQFLGQVGSNRIHREITSIVDFHDRETKAFEPLPLA
jgi:hypothetical protein